MIRLEELTNHQLLFPMKLLQEDIEKEAKTVLEASDLNKLTTKKLAYKIEKVLKYEKGSILRSKKHKALLKDLVLKFVQSQQDNKLVSSEDSVSSSHSAEDSQQIIGSESEESQAKNPNKSIPETKKHDSAQGESSKSLTKGLAAISKLVRAAGIGPKIYKDLPSVEQDIEQRIKLLRKRLEEKDVKFSGKFPTPKEIQKYKRIKEKKQDLEGIDLKNVIEKNSRRKRVKVDYKVKHNSDSEEDENFSSSSSEEEDSRNTFGSEQENELE
eukprot:snap_masked-scaffold_5-processed-gene-5.45-mRNA-1 protein AED:1.00 eAED:1.00 QI:0/-1/0/0/-1/1/1/0/269